MYMVTSLRNMYKLIAAVGLFSTIAQMISNSVTKSHLLAELPVDPLSIAIRKAAQENYPLYNNKSLVNDTEFLDKLISDPRIKQVVPSFLNRSEALYIAFNAQFSCTCGFCPCLCSPCKPNKPTKKHVPDCCNTVSAADEHCVACAGYPNGQCLACSKGYSLAVDKANEYGATCMPNPACRHTVKGWCHHCAPKYQLINGICETKTTKFDDLPELTDAAELAKFFNGTQNYNTTHHHLRP